MKISIGQINIHPGQLSYNYNSMLLMVKKAIKNNCDLIVFPAYCVSGLTIGSNWKNNSFVADIEGYNQKVIALSSNIDILFGSIKKIHDELYPVAYYASNSQLIKNNMGLEYCIKDKAEKNDVLYEKSFFKFGIGKNYYMIDNQKVGVVLTNEYETMDNCDLTINLAYHPYLNIQSKKPKGNLIYVNAVGCVNVNQCIYSLKGNSLYCADSKIINELDSLNEQQVIIDEKNDSKRASNFDILVNMIKEYDHQVYHKEDMYVINYDGSKEAYLNLLLMLKAIDNQRIVVYNFSNHRVPFSCRFIDFNESDMNYRSYLLQKSNKIIVSNSTMVDLGLNNFEYGHLCPLASLKKSDVDVLVSKDIKFEIKEYFIKNEYHEYFLNNYLEDDNFVINLMKMYLNGLIKRSEIGHCLNDYHLDEKDVFIDDLLECLKRINLAKERIGLAGKLLCLNKKTLWFDQIKSVGYFDQTTEFGKLLEEIKRMG